MQQPIHFEITNQNVTHLKGQMELIIISRNEQKITFHHFFSDKYIDVAQGVGA